MNLKVDVIESEEGPDTVLRFWQQSDVESLKMWKVLWINWSMWWKLWSRTQSLWKNMKNATENSKNTIRH